MINGKKVVCVIPARLASTRFPNKMLALLGGKPLLQWVWEAANNVPYFDRVVFAIDAEETADMIKTFNGSFIMTSVSCESGTDRLVELATTMKLEADIWVNWQGDEPFVTREVIDDLMQGAASTNNIWTLKKKITQEHEIKSPNIAKVVTGAHNQALYFSRSPIPFYRDQRTNGDYYKHIGLYAYTTQGLLEISKLDVSPLEQAECLEQLRFLANGLTVGIYETQHEMFGGIDVPNDLQRAHEKVQAEGLL